MKRIIHQLLAIASFLALGARAMGAPAAAPAVVEVDSIETHVINLDQQTTPIPEPTSIAIVLFGAVALLTRRSGRREALCVKGTGSETALHATVVNESTQP